MDPVKTPSILTPIITSVIKADAKIPNYPGIHLSIPDLREKMIHKNLNRTLFLVNKTFPEQTTDFFARNQRTNGTSEKERFVDFIENEIRPSRCQAQERIVDTFALELEKIRMSEAISSRALQYIKAEARLKRAIELAEIDQQALFDLRLRWAPEVKIRMTRWDWNTDHRDGWLDNLSLESSMHPVLLMPGHLDIIEEHLTAFSYSILSAFRNGRQVKNAVQDIISSFENISPDQNRKIIEMAVPQINQFISAGILLEKP